MGRHFKVLAYSALLTRAAPSPMPRSKKCPHQKEDSCTLILYLATNYKLRTLQGPSPSKVELSFIKMHSAVEKHSLLRLSR